MFYVYAKPMQYGDTPKSLKEKESFRSLLLSKHGTATPPLPENVTEAQKEMYRAFSARAEPEELVALLSQYSTATALTQQSSDLKLVS